MESIDVRLMVASFWRSSWSRSPLESIDFRLMVASFRRPCGSRSPLESIIRFPIHFGVIWRLWQRFAGGGWGGPSAARGPRDWPGLGPGPARTGLVRAGLLRLGEVWRQRVGEVWRGVRCGEVWSGLARRGEVRRGLLRYAGVGRGLASTPHEPHRLQVPPSRRREGGVAGGIG